MAKSSLSAPFALLGLALLQLGFMGYLIVGQERIIWQGTEYRFLARPIDPSDPFRGKYIVLDFEAETFTVAANQAWLLERRTDGKAFARLSTDPDGFAVLTELSPSPPAGDHLPVQVLDYQPDGSVWVKLPFDRYYMEESKARPAEEVLREATRRDSISCYAKVKVLDGRSTLTRVMVDQLPIEEYVKQRGL